MTITVNGPGGIAINFPDGTDATTIDRVMRQATGMTGQPQPQPQPAATAQPQHDPLGDIMHLLGFPGSQAAAATVRGAADTGLAGFADEGAAALAIDPTKGDYGAQYEANLQRIRDEQKAAQENYPANYLGGQVAGGLATTALTPEIAPLRALGMAGRVGESVITGGAYGGLYGAGSAEGGLSDRAGGAAGGVGIGAAAGAGGQVAGETIAGLVRGARNVAGTVRGFMNPEAEAARRVATARALDLANPATDAIRAPEEATAALNQQPVMNIDRGGEYTRAVARSAANISPEARATMEGPVQARYRGQAGRTVDMVDEIVGGPGTVGDIRDQLEAAQRAANRPAYMRAFSDPNAQGMWDEGLQQLAGAPVVQDAMRYATVTGKNDAAFAGFPPFRNPFTTDPATGRLSLAVDAQGNRIVPNLQFWDQVKRNLDRVGTREAQQAARVLRGHLDELVPAYGQARGVAAQAFGAEEAVDAGANFVTRRMANDEARRSLAQMGAAERELFALGFARRLVERINEVPNKQDVVNAIFGSRAAIDKVRIALGPERAAQLEAFLRVETLMDRARGAFGNSQTARYLTELGLATAGGTALTGKNPLADPASFVSDPTVLMTALLVRGSSAGLRRMDATVAKRIAEMLVSQDPGIVQRGVQIVSRSQSLMNALRNAGRAAGVVGGEAGVRRFEGQPAPATP